MSWATYADVCSDGLVVSQDPNGSNLLFGAKAVPLSVDAAMFVRGCLTSTGLHVAAFKSHSPGDCRVLCEDGRTVTLGMTYGNQCVLIRTGDDMSRLYVLAQNGPATWVEWWIDLLTLDSEVNRTGTMAATSQGFSDYDAALVPLTNDPLDRQLGGLDVRYLSASRNGLQVAQATNAAQMIVWDGTRWGTLFQGACYEPHLDPTGTYAVCRTDGGVFSCKIPSPIPALIPPSPIVVPNFPNTPQVRWVMAADDPSARYRLTYVLDPLEHDPRNRGVYYEDVTAANIGPSVAMAAALKLPLYAGYNNASQTDPLVMAAFWNACEAKTIPAGVALVRTFQVYPGATVPWVQAVCAQTPKPYAVWLAYYRGIRQVAPPVYTWTEQQVLDQQELIVDALPPNVIALPLFIWSRPASANPPLDGIAAWPSFQASRDRLSLACSGPDILPPSPQPPKPVDSGVELLMSPDIQSWNGTRVPQPNGTIAIQNTDPTLAPLGYFLSYQMTGDPVTPGGPPSLRITWSQQCLDQEQYTQSAHATAALIADRTGHQGGVYTLFSF